MIEKLLSIFEADLAYLRSLGDTSKQNTEYGVRLRTLEVLGGDVTKKPTLLVDVEKRILELLGGENSDYKSIYVIRKEIADKMGVDTSNLKTVYEIALACLNASPIEIEYTVTFKNYDGTILSTQKVLSGEVPVYEGSTPVRESDGEYNYTFNGWLPELGPVTGNVEYVAQFEATAIPVEYTVTFKNYNGTILSTQKVLSGEVPVYTGETPVRESDGEYNYTFSGWLPELGPVTGNVEYVAQFEATAIPADTNYVTFTAEEAGSTLGLTKLSTNQTLQYSTDTTNWNTMNTSTNISLPNTGDKVYVRGILSSNNSSSNYTRFKMTGKIAASGNCNAIWNYEDLEAALKQYCGYYMFYGCKALTTAPELPATTLANSCYQQMFESCTSLVTAPELPATTLSGSCYYSMFSGCTSLVEAPELPATTLISNCYNNMFRLCSSLTTAPELPATTLAYYCYTLMFADCKNLNKITCLATDINSSWIYNWVSGVSTTGTFIKNPAMTSWSSGKSGIPDGWSVEDYVG